MTLTNKDLKEKYDYYITVGRLKEFLEQSNLPDDAKVLVERVEDMYFENHGWKTYNREHPLYKGEEDKFIPAFCCTTYKDDDNLFIKLHY